MRFVGLCLLGGLMCLPGLAIMTLGAPLIALLAAIIKAANGDWTMLKAFGEACLFMWIALSACVAATMRDDLNRERGKI
jgi:hypothetical protein